MEKTERYNKFDNPMAINKWWSDEKKYKIRQKKKNGKKKIVKTSK